MPQKWKDISKVTLTMEEGRLELESLDFLAKCAFHLTNMQLKWDFLQILLCSLLPQRGIHLPSQSAQLPCKV